MSDLLRLSEILSLEKVGAMLVQDLPLESVLEVIIEQAINLADASNAVVLLLSKDQEWFEVHARKGNGAAGLDERWVKVKKSLNRLAVETGEPQVSHDAPADPRLDQERVHILGTRSIVVAPLRVKSNVIGTISVHNKREGPFSQVDIRLLSLFANLAAVAIENARLFQDLIKARDQIEQQACELQRLWVRTIDVQEQERKRIAAEFHDGVIQLIVGALYEIGACRQCPPSHLQEVTKNLHTARKLLDQAIDDTRKIVFDLWPASLDEMGLVPALRNYLTNYQETSHVPCQLRVSGTAFEFPRAVRITIYRIIQEALHNVWKHSGASLVRIALGFGRTRVRISIEDNGSGFDEKKITASYGEHLGLIGMRERAHSIGGRLSFRSTPGCGAKVVLDVPVASPQG